MAEEERSGVTLILFTAIAPAPLTDELSRQGHQVYEALVISEVYALADQYPAAIHERVSSE
jgi:hypothetical protein